jgi:hypothetical protein
LFTVDFVDAAYPVMLSPESSCKGHPVQGKSGTYSTRSKYYREEHWNVWGASEQLASQVGGNDKCVQLEQVVFGANIEWGWGQHKLEEDLTLNGSVAQ